MSSGLLSTGPANNDKNYSHNDSNNNGNNWAWAQTLLIIMITVVVVVIVIVITMMMMIIMMMMMMIVVVVMIYSTASINKAQQPENCPVAFPFLLLANQQNMFCLLANKQKQITTIFVYWPMNTKTHFLFIGQCTKL